MIVVANGKQREARDGATVTGLLEDLKLAPARVVVEHNGKPLGREAFDTTRLQAGDRLEIAQMVGGG